MRILFFVLFLLSYSLSTYIYIKMQGKQKMQNDSETRSFLFSMIPLLFFFFHLWLLSGFWNLKLLAAFASVILVSIVITRVLWAVMGPDEEVNYIDQVRYFGVEFGYQRRLTMLAMMMFGLITLVAFPIIMGIAYFWGDYSPEERMQNIIRYAVLLNVITGILGVSPMIFSLLSSKTTNEDVRSISAIQKVSGTLVTAMWVAMALWAFKSEGEGGYSALAGSALEFKISPLLLAIVVVFLAVTLVLPYLMGAQRGKKWRTRLLQSRRKIVTQVIKALSEPKFESSDLNEVADKIDAELVKFRDGNSTIEFWEQLRDPNAELLLAEEQKVELDDVYLKGRDTDLRFIHLDFLSELKAEVAEMRDILSAQRRKGDIDRFIKRYEGIEGDLNEEIKGQESFRPQIYAVVLFLASAVISQLFSSFGQWAWGVFTGSPPPPAA